VSEIFLGDFIFRGPSSVNAIFLNSLICKHFITVIVAACLKAKNMTLKLSGDSRYILICVKHIGQGYRTVMWFYTHMRMFQQNSKKLFKMVFRIKNYYEFKMFNAHIWYPLDVRLGQG
jgi:hypothetical protein